MSVHPAVLCVNDGPYVCSVMQCCAELCSVVCPCHNNTTVDCRGRGCYAIHTTCGPVPVALYLRPKVPC